MAQKNEINKNLALLVLCLANVLVPFMGMVSQS